MKKFCFLKVIFVCFLLIYISSSEGRRIKYGFGLERLALKYQDFKKFLLEVDNYSLQEIKIRFQEIEDYLMEQSNPLKSFAQLPVEVRNAYFMLIVKGYEKGERIFMESKFLALDQSPQLYQGEKFYEDSVKTVLNYLIDGDERLPLRSRYDETIDSKFFLTERGGHLNFANVGLSILSFLLLNGVTLEDFNISIMNNAPKVLATNAIKDYRDLEADPYKHTLGNKFWPFQPLVLIQCMSLLRIFGIEARYFDISTGKDTIEDLLQEIDENTIILFGFRDPVQPGDIATLKEIAKYIAQKFPKEKAPLIATGGVAAQSRQEFLTYEVVVRNDGRAIIRKFSADSDTKSKKLVDVIFQGYSEPGLINLTMGYWYNKSWDSDQQIPVEVTKLINAWYLDPQALSYDPAPYKAKLIAATPAFLRRSIAVHGMIDFRLYDYRKFWEEKITPPEKLHPKNRYFGAHPMLMNTEHGDCKTGCDFCAYPGFDPLQYKIPVELVIQNIKRAKSLYPELDFIIFEDGNFLSNLIWAKEFFKQYQQEILPLGIKMFIQTTVYPVANKELLKLMKDAGVEVLCVGQEGVTAEFLISIGKLKHPDQVHYFQEAPYLIKKAGIRWPRTSWILFHPKKDQNEVVLSIESIMDQIEADIVTFVSTFVMAKTNSKLMRDPEERQRFLPYSIKLDIQIDSEDEVIESYQVFLPVDQALREVALRAIQELNGYVEKFRQINSITEDIPEQVEIALFFRLILKYLMEHPLNQIDIFRLENDYKRTEKILNYLMQRKVKLPEH